MSTLHHRGPISLSFVKKFPWLQICIDACAKTLDVHCDMCLHDLVHSSDFEQSAAGTVIALQ